ncbi:MAG TPA: histidinol-phosphate transaminase [Syntrophomonas sp.]|nr:histidinol-phosphate transaminase [Syntrophomonas sp.]
MQDFVKRKARQEIFQLKPYIPGKPIEEVKRELGIDNIIKMASNENPLGPSPLAMQAITKALPDIYLYPDGNCYELKRGLAAFYQIPANQIIIGNGSDELLKLIAEAFICKDDEVIFAQPTFSEYEFVSLIMGAQCIKIPLQDYTLDLQGVLRAVTPKTKMIFICNPNNPSGTMLGEQATRQFMEQVPDDIIIVFDEAYVEYVESPDFPDSLAYVHQGRNVIVSRTYSKIYGLASLRVGYAMTTASIAQAIETVMEPFNVNGLAQAGALAALADKAHVAKSRQLNKEGKQYLYREFTRIGLEYVTTQANFILVDCGYDCQEVFRELLQRGIIVRTCDHFGYPHAIRITVGRPEDNQRLINGLEQVLRKLKQ